MVPLRAAEFKGIHRLIKGLKKMKDQPKISQKSAQKMLRSHPRFWADLSFFSILLSIGEFL